MRKNSPRKPSSHTVRFFPPLTESNYGNQLKALRRKLEDRGTLSIQPNKNGVYAASSSQTDASPTGYQDAWLRDNAMVAFSRWQCGDSKSALKTLQGLTTFLQTQAHKMVAIIDQPALSQDVQKRPHVRFNARDLKELGEDWAHAQNDALAYVAWLRFRLAVSNPEFQLSEDERDLYNLFPAYFQAIRYWEDLDSGAWEESRKVNCSSVGAVVAALLEFQELEDDRKRRAHVEATDLQTLIDHGLRTLRKQLPFEAPPNRRTDAALLFLIYPMKVVSPSGPINDQQIQNWILSLIRARLVGSVGIRRYIGDSYYCQDYDKWLPADMRAGDFSARTELRDELLQPGC